MPVDVNGTTYFTQSEVAEEIGVTRQTVWRWCKDGKVPPGRRYRSKEQVFTPEELEEIRGYANRLEPIDVSPRDQLGLFNHRTEGDRQ